IRGLLDPGFLPDGGRLHDDAIGQQSSAAQRILAVGRHPRALRDAADIVVAGAARKLAQKALATLGLLPGLIGAWFSMENDIAVADGDQADAQHAAETDGVRHLGIPVGARLAALWNRNR